MSPLELVKLDKLMAHTRGNREIAIGLIDGPIVVSHPDLSQSRVRLIPGQRGGACTRSDSLACIHGTFIAGILCANSGSAAPAICPDCTLFVRPLFGEAGANGSGVPSAPPEELADAIVEVIEAGARIINLSSALSQPVPKHEPRLVEALNYAAQLGVITVAAAGNDGSIASSVITRHPWVISVAGCDETGLPTNESNLARSIGLHGLAAPGRNITSLGADGSPRAFSGTSVAAPFVTGAIALLWSLHPTRAAAEITVAIRSAANCTGVCASAVWTPAQKRRKSIVPPLLNAWRAYATMNEVLSEGRAS